MDSIKELSGLTIDAFDDLIKLYIEKMKFLNVDVSAEDLVYNQVPEIINELIKINGLNEEQQAIIATACAAWNLYTGSRAIPLDGQEVVVEEKPADEKDSRRKVIITSRVKNIKKKHVIGTVAIIIVVSVICIIGSAIKNAE